MGTAGGTCGCRAHYYVQNDALGFSLQRYNLPSLFLSLPFLFCFLLFCFAFSTHDSGKQNSPELFGTCKSPR